MDCHEEDGGSMDESENRLSKAGKKEDGDELSGMLGALVEPRSEALKPWKAQPPPASANIQVANPSNPVSLLNEKAMKQRVQLSWRDDSSGPDHLKQWQSILTGTLSWGLERCSKLMNL